MKTKDQLVDRALRSAKKWESCAMALATCATDEEANAYWRAYRMLSSLTQREKEALNNSVPDMLAQLTNEQLANLIAQVKRKLGESK